MAGNSSFDEILTTTLKNYVPKLTDNIFSARPLFYALTNGQTIRRVSLVVARRSSQWFPCVLLGF